MLSRKGLIVLLLTLALVLPAALAQAANSQFSVGANNFVTLIFDPINSPTTFWTRVDQNAKVDLNFKVGGQSLIITDVDFSISGGTPNDETVLKLIVHKGSNDSLVFVTNATTNANGNVTINQHLTAGLVVSGGSDSRFVPAGAITPLNFDPLKHTLILHGFLTS